MKYLLGFILGLALIPATAYTATISGLVVFPTLTITDTLSGNQVNFAFEHSFPELATSGLSLDSGTVTLTHFGNLNNEPTAEAWSLLSDAGTLIGKLSNSNSLKTTDSWVLPQNVLNEMKLDSFWKLNVGLTEITPFNSERIDLFESSLSIQYSVNAPAAIPNAPEPSSFFLLFGGLLTLFYSRKKIA